MKNWLRDFSFWLLEKLTPKQSQKALTISPALWRRQMGQVFVEKFNRVIWYCSLIKEFWVVYSLDGDPTIVVVFKVEKGKEIQCLRLEVQHPDLFTIIKYNKQGKRSQPCYCTTMEVALSEAEDALLFMLFEWSSPKSKHIF